MTVYLSILAGAGAQFFADSGVPLSGGKIYTYGAGTTTPAVTYTSSTGSTPNTNPIVLDSAGRPPAEIWLTAGTNYKFVVKTALDVEIRTYDDISGASDNAAVVADLANTSDIAKGDALVGFKQSNSSGALGGAVAKTLHAKMQDVVTVKDFGAVGNGVADDAAAFALADAAGGCLVPPGTYKIATNTALSNPITFAAGAKVAVATGVTFSLSGAQTPVSVISFGAVGDGATDDAAAFQAAINAGAPVYVPRTTSGYKIGTTLSLPTGTEMQGDGYSTLVSAVATGAFVLEVTGNDVLIEGLLLDCGGVAGGTGGIRIRTDLASITRVKILHCRTDQSNMALRDTNHAANLLIGLEVKEFRAVRHQGPGVYFQRAWAYIIMNECTIDYVNSPVTPNFTAYYVEANQGSSWTNCDTTGGTVTASTSSNDGFSFNACWNVHLTNCFADTLGGYGFKVIGASYYFLIANCGASLCNKAGFYLNGAQEVQFANCSVRGRSDQALPLANQHAYHYVSVNRLTQVGCKAVLATGSGYYIDTVTRSNITGCRSDICTGWGVSSTGTNGILVASMGFDLCTAGNASFSSAGMWLLSSVSNSGTLITLTGAGTI